MQSRRRPADRSTATRRFLSARDCRPCHALDVKVSKRDVHSFVVHAVEQIVTLGVSRVEAGVVGRRERPVGAQLTAVDKAARCKTTHRQRLRVFDLAPYIDEK